MGVRHVDDTGKRPPSMTRPTTLRDHCQTNRGVSVHQEELYSYIETVGQVKPHTVCLLLHDSSKNITLDCSAITYHFLPTLYLRPSAHYSISLDAISVINTSSRQLFPSQYPRTTAMTLSCDYASG
jgi:hypothetical protein